MPVRRQWLNFSTRFCKLNPACQKCFIFMRPHVPEQNQAEGWFYFFNFAFTHRKTQKPITPKPPPNQFLYYQWWDVPDVSDLLPCWLTFVRGPHTRLSSRSIPPYILWFCLGCPVCCYTRRCWCNPAGKARNSMYWFKVILLCGSPQILFRNVNPL